MILVSSLRHHLSLKNDSKEKGLSKNDKKKINPINQIHMEWGNDKKTKINRLAKTFHTSIHFPPRIFLPLIGSESEYEYDVSESEYEYEVARQLLKERNKERIKLNNK